MKSAGITISHVSGRFSAFPAGVDPSKRYVIAQVFQGLGRLAEDRCARRAFFRILLKFTNFHDFIQNYGIL